MIRTVGSGAGTPKTDPNIFFISNKTSISFVKKDTKILRYQLLFNLCFKSHHIYIVEKA
jgi:hypothetical protein